MKKQIMNNIYHELEKKVGTKLKDEIKIIIDSELMNIDFSYCNEKPVDNEFLLEKFLESKNIEGCSSGTLKYYYNTIMKLFNGIDKDVVFCKTDDIRSFLSRYQNESKPSKVTLDNVRRIFSSFFTWLEEEDYILKSPIRRIKKIKSEVIIKDNIKDEDIVKIKDNCSNIRDLALIEILSSTGMRVGELVKLNIKDLNFNERSCLVIGKGNKQREVYFDATTKIHITNYVKQRNDEEEALFISKKNKRLTISGVEFLVREIGKRAGVINLHPHKFRRTLATHAIDKGMPIEQVQQLLGHVKIDTTLHYAKVNQMNVKISHRKFIG